MEVGASPPNSLPLHCGATLGHHPSPRVPTPAATIAPRKQQSAISISSLNFPRAGGTRGVTATQYAIPSTTFCYPVGTDSQHCKPSSRFGNKLFHLRADVRGDRSKHNDSLLTRRPDAGGYGQLSQEARLRAGVRGNHSKNNDSLLTRRPNAGCSNQVGIADSSPAVPVQTIGGSVCPCSIHTPSVQPVFKPSPMFASSRPAPVAQVPLARLIRARGVYNIRRAPASIVSTLMSQVDCSPISI